MGFDSVLWGEGLFLRPQHFQVLERQFDGKLNRSESWATPYYYGLHSIIIDKDALSNWRVSLSECHLRFIDGTQLRFPEDVHISPVEIPEDVFESADSRVRVYIGVPELKNGFANTSVDPDAGKRYLLHEQEFNDENATSNEQHLEMRKLNPRILFVKGKKSADESDPDRLKYSFEPPKGFDALPIMQLRLGSQAGAPPKLDPAYIPPLLVKEAWTMLERFVKQVCDRLGSDAERLRQDIARKGIAFSSGNPDDLEPILQLHAVNSALGGLVYFPLLKGIHPFVVYTELYRAAGNLAIFRKDRRLPFPDGIDQDLKYDHDNIVPSFKKLQDLLEMKDVPDPYERKPFAAEGYHLTVQMQPDWLEPSWAFYVGVETELPGRRVRDLLSEDELRMKVGSSEEVDNIFTGGRGGAEISPVGHAPRVFPQVDWHYFRVVRDGLAWDKIERSLNLSIRLDGTLQTPGENLIDVRDRDSGNLVTLKFWLYAIRKPSEQTS